MSQLIYTELEGQIIRWEYKGTVPMEARREASREPKTWNVSTTPADLRAGSSGTANSVYSSNQLAQIVKNGSNAVKLTALKVYGAKVGSPPNPLRAEVRKAVMSSSAEVRRYSPATSQASKELIAGLPGYLYIDRNYSFQFSF